MENGTNENPILARRTKKYIKTSSLDRYTILITILSTLLDACYTHYDRLYNLARRITRTRLRAESTYIHHN